MSLPSPLSAPPASARRYLSGSVYGVVFSGLAIIAVFSGITCSAIAGDLLRGGYSAFRGGAGQAPGSFSPPSAAQETQNAHDVLARTTKAIASVRAMQSAARAIALGNGINNLGPNPNQPTVTLPNVPNGLVPGGLVPSTTVTWTGVSGGKPTQTVSSNGQTIVNVVQNLPDAVLTWSSFNIGKQTALDFNQSAGGADESKWIAFNIVKDPSINPSQILGAINAGGQVYVINQNGIIFGGASSVNVHTLVASSLPINMYLVGRGLLNNPDDQFLFSALNQSAGANGSPAFAPPNSNLANGADGDVTVQPGAELNAPASAENVGGRIALIGPNVNNDGSISTPDGQTILAAGLQVGFGASSDPTLRGLDVYVGHIAGVTGNPYGGPSAGTATNSGLIDSQQGDAYIVGGAVNELGDIASTTSVSLNGRIDLLADYDAKPNPVVGTANANRAPFLFQSTGLVSIGTGSVNDILPDYASTDTVVGSALAIQSTVNIQGQAVHFGANSTLLAPNANVTVDAGSWEPNSGAVGVFLFGATPTGSPQIFLDSGAVINVAGSANISAPVTSNIIPVQLRGAELADDPLQRFGVFRGQTINIDIREQGVYNGVTWVGTPLANASGYVGLIESTVGELTIAGGNVALDAGGSVVLQRGASVNVSGGFINYTGGVVDTTQVLNDGHILDISQATPDLVYQGIFTGQYTVTHPKYGLLSTFTDPILGAGHYENSYVYGGAGGSINIQAPSAVLNGDLLGNTVNGSRQRQVTAPSSSLSLAFQSQNLSNTQYLNYSPTPPSILIEPNVASPDANPFTLNSSGNSAPLRPDELAQLILSPDLTSSGGFGNFSITNGNGRILVPAGVSWTAPVGGAISLTGANVIINGSITIPQGTLSFTADDVSPFQGSGGSLSPTSARGNFVLGAGASLGTAGLLVDDSRDSLDPDTLPLFYSGGSISIKAYSANLASGSVINVSGGVDISAAGNISYGNAGSISVLAGRDPNLPVIGGQLILDSLLQGYSGATGGSLALQDSFVQVGGVAPNSRTLLLSPSFFDKGGFSTYSITGIGALGSQIAVYITPGTQLDPLAENSILSPPTQATGQPVLTPTLLPEQSRTPVSITFKGAGAVDLNQVPIAIGSVVEGAGASIQVDPLGSIAFQGNTVEVLGAAFAPGGSITVSGASSFVAVDTSAFNEAVPTVEIGPHAVLSAAGTLVPTANNLGYSTGFVLSGGSITIKGNIVAERGALLDVSGASATLDLSPAYTNLVNPGIGSLLGAAQVPTLIESNGGAITFQGGQELFTDATLSGNAGGSAALGGTLSVSSGRYYNSGAQQLPTDVTLTVTQSGLTIPASFYASGQSAIGHPLLDKNGNVIPGQGYFSVSDFASSGMDSIALNGGTGMLDFSGPVTISANRAISVANHGTLEANAAVTLVAPYVALGQAFVGPVAAANSQLDNSFQVAGSTYFVSPSAGVGSLTVLASLIDVGNLSLQGISNVSLIANGGDIRGDGTLDVAGNILLRAGQIYPPSDVTFNIIAYNGGTVTIQPFGNRNLPLSAGGTLNIYASTINQDGVLRAPLGSINVGWNGAGASPLDPLSGAGYQTGLNGAGQPIPAIPIAQQITLGAGSITSVSAVDPLTGQALIIPYGAIQNGSTWVDPSGANITSGGVPQKSITISGKNIAEAAHATIDVRGGGDLFAYQFVPGTGGSEDFLGPSEWTSTAQYSAGAQVVFSGNNYIAATSSQGVAPGSSRAWIAAPQQYAIIPGYQALYAPFAPYNTTEGTSNIPNFYNPAGTVSDYGYVNSSLQIGSQIYLGATGALAAGTYTLLPARYALLPGAFLITPSGQALPTGSIPQPDGSTLVSGYLVNGLDSAQTGQPLAQSFDLQSRSVVLNRAQYTAYSGNLLLSLGASSNGQPVPRLPKDGGHLVINAVNSLSLLGRLQASTPADGDGALVDITTNNPNGILIAAPGVTGAAGQLVLDVSALNSFGAGSLLIGGVRSTGANGLTAAISTSEIQVDNTAADPLIGSDIILAATGQLILGDLAGDSGAYIESTGNSVGASNINIVGDGAALRVSSDPSVSILRTGITTPNSASIVVGDGSKLSGGSITIDSSQFTTLGSGVTLAGQSLALDAGHIILNLDENASPANATGALILSAPQLQSLTAGAQSFSLLSYTSIDIYATGQSNEIGATDKSGAPLLQSLALHTSAINGFDGGNVTFAAKYIHLDDSPDSTIAAGATADAGDLTFAAASITLGASGILVSSGATVTDLVNIGQFNLVTLNATGGILQSALGGLSVDAVNGVGGNLTTLSPVITGAKGVSGSISAAGQLTLNAPATGAATVTGGAGSQLTFTAAAITDDSTVTAHAGLVTMLAQTGDLSLGTSAHIDVSGVSQQFFDQVKYTGGGSVSLTSVLGGVSIAAATGGPSINVSAPAGGGDAGTLTISDPLGSFNLAGTLSGQPGVGGKGGSFSLDAGTLAATQSIDSALNAAGFNQSLSFRVRNTASVTVAGTVDASSFQLAVDNGAIDITGHIDADGPTGGTVTLQSSGDLTVASGATISAVGQDFSSAGQGGAISLQTTGGLLTIAAGSAINLSVTNPATTPGGLIQDTTGTLFLQAPQIDSLGHIVAVNSPTAGVSLNIAPIAGTVTGASSIIAAGLYVQDAASTSVASIDDFEPGALANASSFTSSVLAGNVAAHLIAGTSSINPATFTVEPSEEIENSKGSLILNNDWDLSSARFGTPLAVVDQNGNPIFDNNGNQIFSAATPGFLTLRAAGAITFNGALSDGFGDGTGALDEPFDQNGSPALWTETLLPYLQNGSSLQAQRSWSYQITAGADFTAANSAQVLPISGLTSLSQQDSILIGQNDVFATASSPIDNTAIDGFYQVIRTGAGSINLSAAGNVQLLNQFATVYTAGALVTDPTLGGHFDVPILYANYTDGTPDTALYPAQYTMGGGNVTIAALGAIEHLTQNLNGQTLQDSERQMPDNWLYRRGDLGSSGQFDTGPSGDRLSTSWWIDFSNFFEGIGALGGGNVSLTAGGSIVNVDAVVPTNARMPAGTPDASSLVQLGGGDLLVRSGQDINAGVYYVQQGNGVLTAGGSILTNFTRSPSIGDITNQPPGPSLSWLPTTLFLGDGSFDVTARGDLLLGPVSNPFLLPGGAGNSFYYKSYFSTYGLQDSVDVTSLGGDVTLRDGVTTSGNFFEPSLEAWFAAQYLITPPGATAAYFQPWLQINETSILPFATVFGVMPSTLDVTAFSGSVNLVGNLILSPAPDGALDIDAAGSINGLQPNGITSVGGRKVTDWAASTIDLSDADPNSIPGIATPLGYQSIVGISDAETVTGAIFLSSLSKIFTETGSTLGAAAVVQSKEALHAPGLLHLNDPQPLRLYALDGSLSGITLFSAKQARVLAGQDITDVALYVQNVTTADITILSAGQDIIPYDPQSPLRDQASATGNALDGLQPLALPGDLQINGPGTLEVLAGRDLTLGVGSQNADGTGAGITSIGNGRNPYLPFAGAAVIAAAGIDPASVGLDNSTLDFKTFIHTILDSPDASTYFADLALTDPGLGISSLADFNKLDSDSQQQDIVALDLFYLILRDAGRSHNIPGSPGFGAYTAGFDAVHALLGHISAAGSIDLTSREIKTESGGDIDILAPAGQLTVGIDLPGSQPVDQGILTVSGGNIYIYTQGDVNIGTSRIFTLHGGNIVIWSSAGNIAAGASAKTVQSAPPTRVLIDPQSADVETDLAGLATGGGIGVLATLANVPPGSVDLIAPTGVIDAGDAGIRATGNLNLAATQVLNASNIQAGGASAGVPSVTVAAPNLTAISASSATQGAENQTANQNPNTPGNQPTGSDIPSIVTVQVLGYGGGDTDPSEGG
jgi:filamentous hemagglutinin family protein